MRAYDVRPVPEEMKLDIGAIKKMRGTPAQPNPERPGVHIPTNVNCDPDEDEIPKEVLMKPSVHEGEKRRLQITKEMLEEHGYTEDCAGCTYKRLGLPKSEQRPHSEACRKRIEEVL